MTDSMMGLSVMLVGFMGWVLVVRLLLWVLKLFKG